MEGVTAKEDEGIIELSDEDEILHSPPPSPPPGPGGYSRRALIEILSGDDDLDEDALLASPPSSPAKEMKQELMSSDIEFEDDETCSVPQPTTSNEEIETKFLRTKIEDEEERLLATPPPSSPKENNQEHDTPVIAIEDEDTQAYSVQLPSTSNDISEDLDDEVIFISSAVASPQEVYEVSDSDEEDTECFISDNENETTSNMPLDVVEIDDEQLDIVEIDDEQLDESEQSTLDKQEHYVTPPSDSQINKLKSNETDSINPETATTPTDKMKLYEAELTTIPTDEKERNESKLTTILADETESNEPELTTTSTDETKSIKTKSTISRTDEIELTKIQIDEIETNDTKLTKILAGETESNKPGLTTTPTAETKPIETKSTTSRTDEIEITKTQIYEIESNDTKLTTILAGETESIETESTTTPIDETKSTTSWTDEIELAKTQIDEIESNESKLITILTDETESNKPELTTAPTAETKSIETKSTTSRTDEIELTKTQIYEIESNDTKLTTILAGETESIETELATTPIDETKSIETKSTTSWTDEIELTKTQIYEIESNETKFTTILADETESIETELTTTPIDETKSIETKSTTSWADEIELIKTQIDEIESNESKLTTILTYETESKEPELTTTPTDEIKSTEAKSKTNQTDEIELTKTQIDETQINEPNLIKMTESIIPKLFLPHLTKEFKSDFSFGSSIEVSPNSQSTSSCVDSEDGKERNLVQLSIKEMPQSLKSRRTLSSNLTAMVVIPPPRYGSEKNVSGHIAKPFNKVLGSYAHSSTKHSTDDTLPTPEGPTWFDDPMEGPSSRYGSVNTGKETNDRMSPMAHSHTLSSKLSVDTISTNLRNLPIPQVPPLVTENKCVTGRLTPDDLKTFEIIAEFKRITNEQQSKKEECWASYWKTSDHAKRLINNIESYQNKKLKYGRSLKTNGKNNNNRASLQNERDIVNFQPNQNSLTASEQACSHLTKSKALGTDKQNSHYSHALCSEKDIVTTKNIKKKHVTFRDPLEEVYKIEQTEYTKQTKTIHGSKRKNSDSSRGPSKKQQKWNESLQNAARSVFSNKLNTENAITPSKYTNDSACKNQAESEHNLRDIVPKNSGNSVETQVQLQFPTKLSKVKDQTHKNSEENTTRNQNDSSQSVLFLAGTSNQEPHTEQNQNRNIEMNSETAKIKYKVKLKDDLKITFTKRKNSECREDHKKRRCSSDIMLGIEPITSINTTNSTELQTSNLRAYNDSQRLNVQQETERVQTVLPSHEPSSREDLQQNIPPNRNRSPIDFYHTNYFFHNEMIQRSNNLKFFNYDIPPRLETPPPSPEYEKTSNFYKFKDTYLFKNKYK